MKGFSDYLFVFLGDARTCVANFRMREGLFACFSSGKIERAVYGAHSLLL